nr:hypothetical protein [Paracoccus mutanolyticus]
MLAGLKASEDDPDRLHAAAAGDPQLRRPRRPPAGFEDNIHSMCRFLTSKQRRTRCMRAECGAGDSSPRGRRRSGVVYIWRAVLALPDLQRLRRCWACEGRQAEAAQLKGCKPMSTRPDPQRRPAPGQAGGRLPSSMTCCAGSHARAGPGRMQATIAAAQAALPILRPRCRPHRAALGGGRLAPAAGALAALAAVRCCAAPDAPR